MLQSLHASEKNDNENVDKSNALQAHTHKLCINKFGERGKGSRCELDSLNRRRTLTSTHLVVNFLLVIQCIDVWKKEKEK